MMIDLNNFDGASVMDRPSDPLRQTALAADSDQLISTITDRPGISPLSHRPFMSEEIANKTDLVTCLLITANVGTIFEEPGLLNLWFEQLKSHIVNVKPKFVAIHCQEVGGKNYASSMKNVSNFTHKITGDEEIVAQYDRIRIFLDEDYECLEKFTALGSLYLVHSSVKDVKLYNFQTANFDVIGGSDIYSFTSNRESIISHIEKIKFPQELFPESRWSRKGFMRTRWLFNGRTILDLVNIHLFHDASNLVAMKATPSPYAQNRQKALEYTLNKIAEPLKVIDCQELEEFTNNIEVPLFIFGDFNFRLDANKVIERITEGAMPEIKRCEVSNEVLEFVYHQREDSSCSGDDSKGILRHKLDGKGFQSEMNKTNKNNNIELAKGDLYGEEEEEAKAATAVGSPVVMTIGKKLFDCKNLDEVFSAAKNTKWLQEMDNELDSFRSKLQEFKISFSPSYPFKEDTSGAYSYMKTRCPAWCDRILFNASGAQLIHCSDHHRAFKMSNEKRLELLQDLGDVQYSLMGSSSPMGDHKPVLLYCRLNVNVDGGGKRNSTDGMDISEGDKGDNRPNKRELTRMLSMSTAM